MGSFPRTLFLALVLGVSTPTTLWSQSDPEPGQQTQSADGFIKAGRVLLDNGEAKAAEVQFQKAASVDNNSFESRLWILRSWMDQGRSNDTLDGIDDLRDAGHTGNAMDYLYGMAFVRRAEQMIAEGTITSAVSMNISSGFDLLSKALPKEDRHFRDGWISLARAGWHHAGDCANREDFTGAKEARDIARDAADRAVAFYPQHADAHLMRGQVAISQFVAELPEGATEPSQWGAAAAHWDVAVRSFRAALELVDPTPEDQTRQMLAATAGMQLGNTLVWKGLREQAAHAYARGIAWAPWGMNFQTLYNTLYNAESETPLAFVLLALEEGQAGFEKHFGTDSEADATTLWWLGWAALQTGTEYSKAAGAFERAVAKWPEYSDAWYYLFQARYALEDWVGAASALASGWEKDPTLMIKLMQEGDAPANMARVEFLKGKAFGSHELSHAIALANLLAETAQDNPVLWCDLGLFLRERSNQLRESAPEDLDQSILATLHQRAWDAYSRALLLAPDNPQVLNDAAVILQYYLKRDLQVALSMYRAAERQAQAGLDSGALNEAQREIYATALKNARDNAKELELEQEGQ